MEITKLSHTELINGECYWIRKQQSTDWVLCSWSAWSGTFIEFCSMETEHMKEYVTHVSRIYKPNLIIKD